MQKNTVKKKYLSVKDHSVSGEDFELVYNQDFDFLETTPRPSEEVLPNYYESDDYISHTDSKRNLFENAYHFVKKITLKRKLSLINKYVSKEKSLLDFGCGTGDFLQIAQNKGWSVMGIEPNKQARHLANLKSNQVVFGPEQLKKIKPDYFDVITLWHVLEHLPDVNEHLDQFKKLLKPNGTLVIAVPNYKSYDAKIYKEFWAAFDVPRHLWHFSAASIQKVMQSHNMRMVSWHPMWFDAFYVSMLSEKYKTGHLNFFRAFCIGTLSNIKALFTKEYSSKIYIVKKGKTDF